MEVPEEKIYSKRKSLTTHCRSLRFTAIITQAGKIENTYGK
jgi:hypothetical protein